MSSSSSVASRPRIPEPKAAIRRVEIVRRWLKEKGVAGIDDLIEMKRAAARPRDLFDVEELQKIKSRLGKRPE